MELAAKWHRVDRDRVFAMDVEYADLQQRTVGGRADEHGEVLTHVNAAHGVADHVPDLVVGYACLRAGSPILT